MRRITTIFPSCRLFREEEAPLFDTPSSSPVVQDFTNLVIFCRKTTEAFTFREPTDADTLGSLARKHYLLPKHEVPIETFMSERETESKAEDEESWMGWMEAMGIGRRKGLLERYQEQSALGHWWIMRRVLPAVVWESW